MENGKINCWEFKKCGREPGGEKAAELGICIAATDERLDGIHGGINAGRACWAVAGTLCGGEVQGSFAQKMQNCKECDFYRDVMDGDITGFVTINRLVEMLQEQ